MAPKINAFVCYVITNTITGMRYIGITRRTLKTRWRAHRATASSNAVKKSYLHKAILKYGDDAFTIEHVASAREEEDLVELERVLILQERTLSPAGYNLTTGGELKKEYSAETLERMRIAHLGQIVSEETRAKLRGRIGPLSANYGVKFSEETRRLISIARTGTKLSDKHRAEMSARRTGLVRSPEHCKSLSRALKGKPKSAAARAKMSASAKLKRLTPEHKAKIGAAGLGRVQSAETQAKRSASLKRFHEARRVAQACVGVADGHQTDVEPCNF